MLALLFAAIAMAACMMPAQADTYWHLRAGQEIWHTLRVPLDEHYSFTAAGQPWPNHEWLWQALSYGLYRAGGMPLLTAGSAAIIVAAFAIAYRLSVGATATRFLLTLLALPPASCVWALRPQIVSLLLLMVLVTLLVRERTRWLPLLFVLWANVHGAVALGVLALVAATAAALLRARHGDAGDRRRAVMLLLLVPICAAATALTPMGIGLWRFIGESMARSRQTRIDEWQPTTPTGGVEIFFWVVAAAFLVLLWKRRRSLATASWSDQAIVAIAFAVLPLAFRAVRNVAPFALVAVPAAARLLGADFRLRAEAKTPPSPDRPRLNAAILGLVLLLAFGGVGTAWATSHPRLGWRPVTAGALAAARTCPGPMFNRYNDGGYLIWFVPERRVFIDSRQDPYPLPFLLETLRVEQGAPPQELFARWAIRCAFLPVESPVYKQLADARWRPLHVDDRWAVMSAPGP
jgi:hypothetical protein